MEKEDNKKSSGQVDESGVQKLWYFYELSYEFFTRN